MASYWDRLSTSGAKQLSVYNTLSDLEVSNIRTALASTSPSLTKILKNYALTPQNFPLILRSISNDGTGSSWQQFIRGEFTSEYLRTITENDYAILNSSFIDSLEGDIVGMLAYKHLHNKRIDAEDLYQIVNTITSYIAHSGLSWHSPQN